MPAVAKADTKTLLVLGDSLSAAYGLQTDQGWVSLLEKRLKSNPNPQLSSVKIVNASISGETTTGGLNRLPALLERHQPQWLIVELGGNDGLRGTPIKLIQRNLSQIVSLAQHENAEVLILGMRIPPNYGPRYTQMFFDSFAEVAEQKGTGYLPFFLEGVGGVPRYIQPDGIHPNAEAQPLMLDNLWPVTLELLRP